jgi:non-lysosomal glucosylceramidase
VQRTYALNDEPGLLICDYGKAERPRIPFPYYAEVWTGFEYAVGSQMVYAGMMREGLQCITGARSRYDGKRRNPWDEAECGHHYARAMSAWSGLLALSGFRYDGARAAVTAMPRINPANFRGFWSTGTGWGAFATTGDSLTLRVLGGNLPCASCEIRSPGKIPVVSVSGTSVAARIEQRGARSMVAFDRVVIGEGGELRISARANRV